MCGWWNTPHSIDTIPYTHKTECTPLHASNNMVKEKCVCTVRRCIGEKCSATPHKYSIILCVFGDFAKKIYVRIYSLFRYRTIQPKLNRHTHQFKNSKTAKIVDRATKRDDSKKIM